MATPATQDEFLTTLSGTLADADITGRDIFAEFILHGASQLEVQLTCGEEITHAENHDSVCTDAQIQTFCELLQQDVSVLDELYAALVSSDERRTRGQFFTPGSIAEFMVSVLPDGEILDPAVGTGVFPEHLMDGPPRDSVLVNDADPLMLCATELRLAICDGSPEAVSYSQHDYLATEFPETIDGIVCNPPYNKFQNHDSLPATDALADSLGISVSGFSNIYPLFLLKAIDDVSDGRIVFITPSEYLDTGYGAEFKQFLLENVNVRAIVSLNWDASIFSEALTTAAITIIDTGGTTDEIDFIRSESPEDLDSISSAFPNPPDGAPVRVLSRDELDADEKWSRYFESAVNTEYLNATVPLERLADVKRGIATGHNDFFTLTEAEIAEWGIEDEYLEPVLSKAAHAPHLTFTQADFDARVEEGKNMHLLHITSPPSENTEAYLQYGKEVKEAHDRYLTSHRDPWYAPESREPAPILATVFSRENMRFVRNECGARNLAAFHCVYPHFDDEERIKAFLGYLNSNHALQLSKLQKRRYADGLDKFEPGDLSEIPVLDVRMLSESETSELADAFTRLDTARRQGGDETEAVAAELNDIVLRLLEKHREQKSKERIDNWT